MLKNQNPLQALLNKENRAGNETDSLDSYASTSTQNFAKHTKRVGDKGVKHALQKHYDCLKQIKQEIKAIRSKKTKEDKNLVLNKVKEIERALEKNEEKHKFEQFTNDLLMVI